MCASTFVSFRHPWRVFGFALALLFAGPLAGVQAEDEIPEPVIPTGTDTPATDAPTADAPSAEAPSDAAAAPEGPSPWKSGPRAIDLGNGADLQLPANYDFLPQPEAGMLMERMGNLHNEDLIGLVASNDKESQWFVVLSFEDEGYVKDDETIDAAEMLDSMREALPDVNKEREAQGFPPISLDGWSEEPHYDQKAHHLVWCLRVSDKEGTSANYNTRILGRKGFLSLNLVTDTARVDADKPHAATLLAATHFQKGARYEDFDESQDKVAEYGLAGLIAGGAGLGAMKLVKLGLMAKMWKVILAALIAGKKVVVAGLIAAGVGLKKLFSKSDSTSE